MPIDKLPQNSSNNDNTRFNTNPINAGLVPGANVPKLNPNESPSKIEREISDKLASLNIIFKKDKEALKAFNIITDGYKNLGNQQEDIAKLLGEIKNKATDNNFTIYINENFGRFVIRAETTSLEKITNKLKNNECFNLLQKYGINVQIIQYGPENFGK
ncbi:MAG: hypothetical protein N4A38_01665 [Candidatus Gracilibacteria bacterium]|nr:hypothetical protein [Candidatus Gracilibacteria bacterium]